MIEILQDYWRPLLWMDGVDFSGLSVTLFILVLCVGLGFILSLPLAILRVSKNRLLSRSVWLYTYIFRGTPLYVQLLFFYQGMYDLDVVREVGFLEHFFSEGYNCTILAYTLNTCAYTTEVFAGAIKSTPYGEIEAGRAYGMSKFTLYRRIIIPSMLRRTLPAYSNEVILMLHATTLAFTATVPDILKVARDINAATYNTFTAYGLAAVLYLCITFILVALFRKAENRWLAYLRPVTNRPT